MSSIIIIPVNVKAQFALHEVQYPARIYNKNHGYHISKQFMQFANLQDMVNFISQYIDCSYYRGAEFKVWTHGKCLNIIKI